MESNASSPILGNDNNSQAPVRIRRWDRLRRFLRWPSRLLGVAVLGLGGFWCWRMWDGNFAEVRPGELYRCAQVSDRELTRLIKQYGVRTVLNLRGPNPDQTWYLREREATLKAGATQIDIAMSSSEWMSRQQAQTLIETLKTADRPILMHCWRGAERTGLASVISELLRPGVSVDEAKQQFTFWHLYVRAGEGKVMSLHIEQYERWLAKQGQTHSPERLEEWIANGFKPGGLGRDTWPYDPYPLVVITRP